MKRFNFLYKKSLLLTFLSIFVSPQSLAAATTPGDKSEEANSQQEQENKKKKSLKDEWEKSKKRYDEACEDFINDVDQETYIVEKEIGRYKKWNALVDKKLVTAKLNYQYWKKQLEIQNFNTKASDAEDLASHKFFAVLWYHKKKSFVTLILVPAAIGGVLGHIIFSRR